MSTFEYIIDETPFIYAAHRGDSSDVNRLRKFLEYSDKKNKNAIFKLHMPKVSQLRLGRFFWYKLRCKFRLKIRAHRNQEIGNAMERRLRRVDYSRTVVRSMPRRRLRDVIFKKVLLDLYMYVNHQKSLDLDGILPNQIIPIETCVIAQIAHNKNLPILSYNADFNYFTSFWDIPNYIQFHELGDFLSNEYLAIVGSN